MAMGPAEQASGAAGDATYQPLETESGQSRRRVAPSTSDAQRSHFRPGCDEARRAPPSRSHDAYGGANFLECPMIEEALRKCGRISRILDEVTRHYEVDLSVVTWRADGKLHFKTGQSTGTIDLPQRLSNKERQEYQLFNHTISRELPIIVDDLTQDEVYGKADLPPFAEATRFYAAAPLMRAPGTYIGTLCIVSSSLPRGRFGLRDADFLTEKAEELVAAAEGFHDALGAPGEACEAAA